MKRYYYGKAFFSPLEQIRDENSGENQLNWFNETKASVEERKEFSSSREKVLQLSLKAL